MLLCLQGLGQAMAGAARPEWLLLAFVRRPSGHEDDLEGRRQAPVGKRMARAVAAFQGRKEGSGREATRPLLQRTGLAHAPQIVEQP